MAEVRLLSDQLGVDSSGFIIGYASCAAGMNNVIVGTYNYAAGSARGSVLLGRNISLGTYTGCGYGVAVGQHIYSAWDGDCVMIGVNIQDRNNGDNNNVLIGSSVDVYGTHDICIGSSLLARHSGAVLIGKDLEVEDNTEGCVKIGQNPVNNYGSSHGNYVCMGSTHMSIVCTQDGLGVAGYYTGTGSGYGFFIPWSQLEKVNNL